MKRLLLLIAPVIITLTLILLNSPPVFSQEQPDLTINAAMRSQVIEGVLKKLNAYVFPDVADKMQADIRTRLQNREYDRITSAAQLAKTLTAQMQAISNDKHLEVFYSQQTLPPEAPDGGLNSEVQQQFREIGAWLNSGFQKVERLSGNIGYLELNLFPPPEFGGEVAISAMHFLSNSSALIVDLRQNGGGDPRMVALLSTYLFDDKPIHLNTLYWRDGNSPFGKMREPIQQFWTLDYVPGQRYLNKEVYVLTSKETISAAEEFTYNLKQLKRAKIVGEITAGAANPGKVMRLNDHFRVFVATGRAINPITKTNWEGKGVEPDVKVPANLALKTAHLAAMQGVLAQTTEAERTKELKEAIKTVQRELDALKK